MARPTQGLGVMSNVDLHATLQNLLSIATAQGPQYTGHFANYKLVRLKCNVQTKAGLAFKQGEYALATPRRDEMPGLPSSGKFVTVWSRRNKGDTSVRATEVEWLDVGSLEQPAAQLSHEGAGG